MSNYLKSIKVHINPRTMTINWGGLWTPLRSLDDIRLLGISDHDRETVTMLMRASKRFAVGMEYQVDGVTYVYEGLNNMGAHIFRHPARIHVIRDDRRHEHDIEAVDLFEALP